MCYQVQANDSTTQIWAKELLIWEPKGKYLLPKSSSERAILLTLPLKEGMRDEWDYPNEEGLQTGMQKPYIRCKSQRTPSQKYQMEVLAYDYIRKGFLFQIDNWQKSGGDPWEAF